MRVLGQDCRQGCQIFASARCIWLAWRFESNRLTLFGCSEEFDEIHTEGGGKKQLLGYCIGTLKDDDNG